MLQSLVLVGLGGMLGSMARYLAGYFIKSLGFPFSTLIVNLSGSLLIGWLMAKWGRELLGEDGRLFLVVGLCGGFTTLSALSWENWQFLQAGKYLHCLGYSILTVLGGLMLTALGYYWGK